MKAERCLIVCFFVLAFPAATWGQAEICAELQAAKKATYGFRPSELAKEQQQQKSTEMDSFWNLVKEKGQPGVTCLRGMLLAEKEDGFFVFDGSSLLLSLDQSDDSLAAASQALRYANLKEVESAAYIKLALHLSRRGVDIGPLADKYLRYPEVDTYLPQHAMKLDRELGAIILYGSMSPEVADGYLETLLEAKESYTRNTAVLLLALNMTERSLRALNSLPDLNAFPEGVAKEIERARKHSPAATTPTRRLSREQVLERLNRIVEFNEALARVSGEQEWDELMKRFGDIPTAAQEDFESSASATLKEEDISLLRRARTSSISGVSDEVFYEYFALTRILRNVVNRLDLYSQYRDH